MSAQQRSGLDKKTGQIEYLKKKKKKKKMQTKSKIKCSCSQEEVRSCPDPALFSIFSTANMQQLFIGVLSMQAGFIVPCIRNI